MQMSPQVSGAALRAGSDAAPILQIRDVSKTFGSVVALRRMDLTVHPGRVHTILGENGAGKSTLMKILAGLFRPTSGSILLRGAPYEPRSPREASELGLAIVFQELSLCRNLTVAENILATREPTFGGFVLDGATTAKARALVADLGLPINVRTRVSDLSIAQQQLVEIAKGLSHPADVIILDEPTSSLSDSEAEILFGIIGRLKANGKAIIYVSHRMQEIMRLSDDITVIRDGEYVTTVRRDDTTIDRLIALMVGRPLKDVYPPRPVLAPSIETAPVLSVRGLSSPGAFDDVAFAVRPGEILGFFGLIGAGRSEVMKAIFGLLPSTGTVEVEGKAAIIRGPADAIRRGIAFATENRKEEGLVLAHAVERNINMVAVGRLANRLGFARPGAERAAARTESARLSIKASGLDTVVGTLSGGNQQKVVLAKWLSIGPRILILDEPTRGVDVGAKFEIYRIIRALAAEGTAILLVSSDLPEVLGMSDRVVVMHEGRVSSTLGTGGLAPKTVMAHAAGTHT